MSSTQRLAPLGADAVEDHAAALAALHVPKDPGGLEEELFIQLVRVLPDQSFYLLLYEEANQAKVVLATSDGPHAAGDRIEIGVSLEAVGDRIPMPYKGSILGELRCEKPVTPAQRDEALGIMAHYTVALVNLTLNEDTRRTTEDYCASLMALEEGVILFQEADSEAITARFLGLATTMMKSAAGALYVLEEVGNVDSALKLVQCLGVPEDLLERFETVDGSPWAASRLTQPAQFAERAAESFAGLDTNTVPDALNNVAVLPLTYHGVCAGIVALFNCEADLQSEHNAHVQLDRMKSLGELGAALLHRISLEAINLRTQEIDTQLAIAANIQSRLQPRKAPEHPGLQCAWRSLAAQNIGGDYLDLHRTDSAEVLAVIADASGHGINSALLMTSFRATWRAESPRMQPLQVLGGLNREVCYEVGTTGMFITAVSLRMNPNDRTMTISSAGHNDTYLYRAATRTIEHLESDGPPLGFMDGIEYEEHQHQLEVGDILLLYTDGIVEAMRPGTEEMFGDERLERLLIDNAERNADEILELMFSEMETFTENTSNEDDVSISVIKVMDPKVSAEG